METNSLFACFNDRTVIYAVLVYSYTVNILLHLVSRLERGCCELSYLPVGHVLRKRWWFVRR